MLAGMVLRLQVTEGPEPSRRRMKTEQKEIAAGILSLS